MKEYKTKRHCLLMHDLFQLNNDNYLCVSMSIYIVYAISESGGSSSTAMHTYIRQ